MSTENLIMLLSLKTTNKIANEISVFKTKRNVVKPNTFATSRLGLSMYK